MITIKDVKNFFQEYLGCILLAVFSVSFLSAGVYYLVIGDQLLLTIVNQKLASQTKKENLPKIKKISFNPITDNIYWLIINFIVYYFIYLVLRLTDRKKETVWAVPLSIFLWKFSLVAFSSYFYQKNRFLQNLNKSINPVYFISQGVVKVIFSLVGYGALATLVYYDYKDSNKPEEILGCQPAGWSQKQNAKEKEIPQNNAKDLIAYFQSCVNFFSTQEPYKEIIDFLANKQIFDFNQIVQPIKEGIKKKKISANIIENNLIVNEFFDFNIRDIKGALYFEFQPQFPFLNGFFFYLKFFFDQNYLFTKKFVNNFLKELIKNPNDQKIMSLQNAINELFYFNNCINNLSDYLFGKTKYVLDTSYLTDVNKIKKAHLTFLDKLIKRCNLEFFLFEKTQVKVGQYQEGDIKKIYFFLIDEENRSKIAIYEKEFWSLTHDLSN